VIGDVTNNSVTAGTSESWYLRNGVATAPAVAPTQPSTPGGSSDAWGACWGACWDVARYTDENFSRHAGRNAYRHAAGDGCAAGRVGDHVI
jgi:hypothetical protein